MIAWVAGSCFLAPVCKNVMVAGFFANRARLLSSSARFCHCFCGRTLKAYVSLAEGNFQTAGYTNGTRKGLARGIKTSEAHSGRLDCH